MWGGGWTETRGGTQGRGHVTTEAAIRVMPPEATDTEGRRPPPDTRRQGSSFLGTFRGSRTCRHLDFGLRASGRHFCCCEPPGLWPQGTKHSARIHDHRATTGPPPRHTHTQYTPSIVHDGAANSVCGRWGQRLAVGRPRAAHLLHLCDPASAPEAACGFSSSVIQAIKSHPPPHRAATLTVPHERALSPKTPCVN